MYVSWNHGFAEMMPQREARNLMGCVMDEQAALVDTILRLRKIRRKLVVLCEGDVVPISKGKRPSPQMYGRHEHMPDANFYRACVPRNWQSVSLPVFFNCGGRSQVLATFQALLAAHRADPDNSNLTPEKLYALVDLDIQADVLPMDYHWPTTEHVHAALYDDGAIKRSLDDRHRIWVTALIHKEAFFVLPGVDACLTDGVPPFWNGAPFDLRAIHAAIAERFGHDGDVLRHFAIVNTRLTRFLATSRLDCTNAACFAQSWIDAAKAASNDEYESLAKVLLAVAKAKDVWNEVVPEPGYGVTMRAEDFRDQLALKIGAAISMLEPSAHPLAGFFAWLEPRR